MFTCHHGTKGSFPFVSGNYYAFWNSLVAILNSRFSPRVQVAPDQPFGRDGTEIASEASDQNHASSEDGSVEYNPFLLGTVTQTLNEPEFESEALMESLTQLVIIPGHFEDIFQPEGDLASQSIWESNQGNEQIFAKVFLKAVIQYQIAILKNPEGFPKSSIEAEPAEFPTSPAFPIPASVASILEFMAFDCDFRVADSIGSSLVDLLLSLCQ